MGTFYHANSTVCSEVAKNGRRSLSGLVVVFVNLTACIVFIFFVFDDEKLYMWYVYYF